MRIYIHNLYISRNLPLPWGSQMWQQRRRRRLWDAPAKSLFYRYNLFSALGYFGTLRQLFTRPACQHCLPASNAWRESLRARHGLCERHPQVDSGLTSVWSYPRAIIFPGGVATARIEVATLPASFAFGWREPSWKLAFRGFRADLHVARYK